MLKLKNVSANLDNNPLIENINLEIKIGEIHAILGPKGSGKSSLAHLVQGNQNLKLTSGSIHFQNKNINKLSVHTRSKLGIFTTFQHPVPIEGLTNLNLLKSALMVRDIANWSTDIDNAFKILTKNVGLDSKFKDDTVNNETRPIEDFRKSEILQMIMIRPSLIILDEIDQDLDEESLDFVTMMIKNYIQNNKTSLIIITHNQNFLDRVMPDHVHIMVAGKIVHSGTTDLYKRIIEDGYSQFSQS